MNTHNVPFVMGKGCMVFISTLIFDFYMFLQLVLFYVTCLILGALFLILDRIFRTKKLTNSLASFFEYVANL